MDTKYKFMQSAIKVDKMIEAVGMLKWKEKVIFSIFPFLKYLQGTKVETSWGWCIYNLQSRNS